MQTVLVADDESAVLALLQDALTYMGYEVLAASSGAQVLHLEATHPGPIDLLITDIVMSDLSGPDLARAFTTRRPHAKVLYISGTGDFDGHTIAIDPGVPILTKPFTLDALERTVREILVPLPFGHPADTR